MSKVTPVFLAILCPLILCSAVAAATYFVSPSGDDRNPGTSESRPFQMVQRAIDGMKAGDTLVVLDGFYTGTLKIKSGITIRAMHPRKVVFSGAEPVTSAFEQHAANVYKAKIGTPPKQLFYKNQPMTWACWPNLSWSENWIDHKKWAASAPGSGPGKLKADGFSQLKELNLAGAYCFLRYSKGNSCFSRFIKSFDGTTLHWDDTEFYSVEFGGEDGSRGSPAAIAKGKADAEVGAKFFLAGALDLLDSEGEWFAKDGFLYFYAPGGGQPDATNVLGQINDYAIVETGKISDVSIEGIDFFATSVKLGNPGNKNISFHDVHFSYIGAELLFIDQVRGAAINKPVQIEGQDIRIDKCLFAGAQNTALRLVGSNITVQNCVFLENNRHANFAGRALAIAAKGTFKITRNTFFNNCPDAILINSDSKYVESAHPDVSYNNIFNAGIYNTDVSGVYMPNLSQHDTEFHHNWVHNVKGNGVRLDQAGEKLSVHHNVFWASKRGLNIEGFGNFNIYNNTSVLNHEACFVTRNVVTKRKGTGNAHVSNDTTFPPITDWNILNNLVAEFVDRVGPSERGPFTTSLEAGKLHPERPAKWDGTIPIKDRGTVQGNLTKFSQNIFTDGTLKGLNLIPADEVVKNGVVSTDRLRAQNVTALDSFRGAYDYHDKGWSTGSDWLPYSLKVPVTMAESEAFAKRYQFVSIVPSVNLADLRRGYLSSESYTTPPGHQVISGVKKAKKKN